MKIKLPVGFYYRGINSGIKKNNKFDLAIFYSIKECSIAKLFTKNKIKAAPVIISKDNKNTTIRAIVANSGCANAATGKIGISDAIKMCSITAKNLSIKPEDVLVASTGLIGNYLPIKKVINGIKLLCKHLKKDIKNNKNQNKTIIDAVKSIMTTDTKIKIESEKFKLDGKTVTILGCAKGSGMIRPELSATMLCFLFTDCNISNHILQNALKESVRETFNRINIDNVCSTNDTVFLMANGMAGNKIINTYNENYKKFCKILNNICLKIAKKIVMDGEGVTKFIELEICRAKTKKDAEEIAKTISGSCLFKTAIFGSDPNWGRIIASIGESKAYIIPEKINIFLNNLCVCKNSTKTNYSQNEAREIVKKKNIKIKIDLNCGKYALKYYTSDLSYKYVKINSEYST